ncbi:hypothetical protein CDO52_00740 [Nocardiopsis gilva YIM 90087]|uniref:DUF3168 domain-containing protein n=1 Tax=Nocardiopsis gilva YIM 90087 TaxID=1235441 RepID=A0A223S055_9ACTN|nr:hypothetical protein [Nocardiopsis gilva]ASU81506.1 hypothetical protein CDO52_00740 [Nocardiopsis gilva YIM 90087]
MSVSAVRSGLAARLETISGLQVWEFVEGPVNPPAALIVPGVPGSDSTQNPPIDYSKTYQDGSHDLLFTIKIFTSMAHAESGQSELDDFLAPTGSTSVLAAVEGDDTLGGAADFSVVPMCTFYGILTHNKVDFYGAEFLVRVTVS